MEDIHLEYNVFFFALYRFYVQASERVLNPAPIPIKTAWELVLDDITNGVGHEILRRRRGTVADQQQ